MTVEISATDQRWEIEKEEARVIQQSLLPAGSLRGPSFEVSCKFSPYSEVGGDFADFFNLLDGRAGIYVGDVAGKGLSAAMYAALAMGMLRGIHKSGVAAASVLTLLNKRLMVRPVAARYCATLYATFDPKTLQLEFSNAGLPHPLRASTGRCEQLGEGGTPSGIFAEVGYDQYSIQLSRGDTVLFATDGLHEMKNAQDQFMDAEELGELWRQCAKRSANESLDYLFSCIRAFANGARPQQHDDITAVVLKVL